MTPDPGSALTGAERERSVAPVSAAVERRKASALRFQRTPQPYVAVPHPYGAEAGLKTRHASAGVLLPFLLPEASLKDFAA
jgi:hypothetical protein